MTFGRDDGFWQFGANAADSHQMFDLFVEAGGNFVDTALVYGGTSEALQKRCAFPGYRKSKANESKGSLNRQLCVNS
ncbi:protein of unknown function [Denitratisoma oestradiolicum]|uniref:NADP-dependent oxidoreductase domain-containing protein n=1 Tax=Denitratisoma oestradiolicum TaxID=311182 RepID=A0A6S6Y1S0_9PROT|nr:aldo/keto reductase [Denitratisoma oestradiolicum]CAB1370831.1 protein of unknown function [Denitratisoma oestradiolicum]